jgi:hypothetical protein
MLEAAKGNSNYVTRVLTKLIALFGKFTTNIVQWLL